MIKLKPKYYGVWLGLLLGVLLIVSAITQQYNVSTEQTQSLVNIRAELKAFIQKRIKEVPVEQVKTEAREFLDTEIKANPALRDKIYAEASGSVATEEQNILYGANFMGGIAVVFGSLMYLARKKQKFGGSKKWLVLEIFGALVFVGYVFYSILSSGWYEYPIDFILIPFWIAVVYTALFFMKPIEIIDVEFN